MKLVILHGAPGSGKLTIAKALASQNSYSILHNHLTIDLALSIYPEFGAGDFYHFVNFLRETCISKAIDNGVDVLLVTLVYDGLKDWKKVQSWKKIVLDAGGEVVPIFLHVALEELDKRVVDPSRLGTFKISSAEGLRECISAYDICPIPFENVISLDTTGHSIQESIDAVDSIIRQQDAASEPLTRPAGL